MERFWGEWKLNGMRYDSMTSCELVLVQGCIQCILGLYTRVISLVLLAIGLHTLSPLWILMDGFNENEEPRIIITYLLTKRDNLHNHSDGRTHFLHEGETSWDMEYRSLALPSSHQQKLTVTCFSFNKAHSNYGGEVNGNFRWFELKSAEGGSLLDRTAITQR